MENKILDERLNQILEEAEPLMEKLEKGTITKEEKKRLDELGKEADKIHGWYNVEMF